MGIPRRYSHQNCPFEPLRQHILGQEGKNHPHDVDNAGKDGVRVQPHQKQLELVVESVGDVQGIGLTSTPDFVDRGILTGKMAF